MEESRATTISNDLLIKFIIDDESFGVNISNVREIIEIPKITTVPKTPDYFAGIINLRGEVFSVIDARLRFGVKAKPFDELSRIALTYFKGGLVGMIVDDVNEVVRVKSNSILPPPPILKNINTNYLRGVVETDSGEKLLLLNLEAVINLKEFEVAEGEKQLLTEDLSYEKIEAKEEGVQIITFSLQKELYAVGIKDAEEIIKIPEIILIPQAPDFIRGVISLRGNIIPIIDLHTRFHYDKLKIDENTSIIIVDVGNCMIGLIVDSIAEIMHVPKRLITKPPPTLSKLDIEQLYGIIKLEDGGKSKIISYLSLNNLFTEEELKLLMEVSDDKTRKSREAEKAMQDKSDVIVNFIVGEDTFTIPVRVIVEITRYPMLTKVPNAPSFVEGVMNLRGEIVFVIDLRSRFGFQKQAPTDDTRLIIADIEGIKTGLIVDEVDAVKTIYHSQIEPAPKILTNIENDYIQSVVKIKDKEEVMIMLNLLNLLNKAEKKAIRAVDVEIIQKQISKKDAKKEAPQEDDGITG